MTSLRSPATSIWKPELSPKATSLITKSFLALLWQFSMQSCTHAWYMSASSSGQRDMQASRFPPGQLLFGSLVVAGSVGSGPSVPDVVPVGAAVGGSVGGRVVESTTSMRSPATAI